MSCRNGLRRLAELLLLLAVVLSGSTGYAQEDCGRPGDAGALRFGPFDYNLRDTLTQQIQLVESSHFTAYMEEMALYGFSSRQAQTVEEVAGEGRSLIAGNLDYTLYAFPNHHRALHAMATWQLRLRKQSMARYQGLKTAWRFLSAECYFERALIFTPSDGVVHLAYGVFLHKVRDLDKAAVHYERAIELTPSSPEPHYNLGLLYFDRKDYEHAAQEAAVAYDLGYPLPGLKNKLADVGVSVASAAPPAFTPAQP